MELTIFAVGRMKKGAERDLTERYADRLAKAGPAIGLNFGGITEIAESRAASANARRDEESGQCLAFLETRPSQLIVFDERGKHVNSEQFAEKIGDMRDRGAKRAVFAIGGPDGHTPELLDKAHMTVALGRLTWPHQIARILVTEQLYRAVTILAGHPYHRP